jgi:hypothetical protein
MTPFGALCALCGLSLNDASTWLKVRLDTAKSWSNGRRRAPQAIIEQLRDLHARQRRAALEGVAEIRARGGDGLEGVDLTLPATDIEAQARGWPCVGAMRAMLAIVVAETPGVDVDFVR